MNAQANYYNKLWSLQNFKSVIYAFCKGFADSLKFSDIFFLDSMDQQKNLEKQIEKDQRKERLLHHRGDSPGPSSDNLAKKRALEKRSGKVSSNSNKEPERNLIMERTIKCCVLNGCFFWFSIVVFENFMMPALHWLVLAVLGATAGNALWSNVVPMLSVTFTTLWILPFYLLSKVVNSIWFADIADTAFAKKSGRPRMMTSFSVSIADTVFTIVVETIFLVQSTIFSMCIPIAAVSKMMSIFHLCLLNALYSFEYKWYNQGLELHKRLAFIESHWPYFLGFGMPLALIASYPDSQVVSGCVFSILFPLFLVSGNQAQVKATFEDVTMKIFNPTIFLSNMIFSRTLAIPGNPQPITSPRVSNSSREPRVSFTTANS